jgi:hypothetical protein
MFCGKLNVLSFIVVSAVLIFSSSHYLPIAYVRAQQPMNATPLDQTGGAGAPSQLNFSKPINLSNGNASSMSPQIAASGNNVYVVWQDYTPGNYDIFLAKSTNGGHGFGTPINLSNDKGNSTEPSIAVAGNNVYVVWSDDTISPGISQVYFAKSTNGGATFSDPSNLGFSSHVSSSPKVAVGENNSTVYVTWVDGTLTHSGEVFFKIYFKKSTAGGDEGTFGGLITIDPGTLYPYTSSTMDASGKSLLIAWLENRTGNPGVFFSASADGGSSFGRPMYIASNNPEFFKFDSGVALSGNNQYVAWSDNSTGDTFQTHMIRSTNGGASFSRSIDLSHNPTGTVGGYLALAASGSGVYAVWDDNSTSNTKIHFTMSTNGGASFNKPIVISHTPGRSIAPTIRAYGNNVYVAWIDDSPGVDSVFFTKATTTSTTILGTGSNINNQSSTANPVRFQGSNSTVNGNNSITNPSNILPKGPFPHFR